MNDIKKKLKEMLQDSGLLISVVNPRWVRDFAKSRGVLSKTDKIDAFVIKEFGCVNTPIATAERSLENKQLNELKQRRNQLVKMLRQEKNHLELASKAMKKDIKVVLNLLEKRKKSIEEKINSIINAYPALLQQNELMISIPGVSSVTSISLLCELPELGTLTKKQIASLVGLAPHCRDSGSFKGKRSIYGGRQEIRNNLYCCALSASRHNPVIKAYYEKLLSNGKLKKVALVACAHKLLGILNSMLKYNNPWMPDFTS